MKSYNIIAVLHIKNQSLKKECWLDIYLKIDILDLKVIYKRPQNILFWVKHDSWTAQKLQGTCDTTSPSSSYTSQVIGDLSVRR